MNHIVHRFIRLFPVFAIAWTTGTLRWSSSGTKINELFAIFYLLNCHPDFGKISYAALAVLLVTWSLTADMHAHVFILLVLILAKSNCQAIYFLLVAMAVQVFFAHKICAGCRSQNDSYGVYTGSHHHQRVHCRVAEFVALPMGNITITEEFTFKNPLRLRDQLLYFHQSYVLRLYLSVI